jgi:tripartite-type tricarboxylate transporter receptor subunit TctC
LAQAIRSANMARCSVGNLSREEWDASRPRHDPAAGADCRAYAGDAQSWPAKPITPSCRSRPEAGYRDSEYNYWVGIFVAANTPRDIVEKLNRETTKAMQAPAIAAKLAKFGAEAMIMSVKEFDAYVSDQFAKDEKLVKALGIAVQD